MRSKILALLVSLLAVALLAGCAGAAAPSVLQFPIMPWIPAATAAVLAIITVAAIVYALSGTIASSNARNWSRVQIYEALLSLILIAIFGAFSYMFFINPQGAFGALNLIPKSTPTLDCTTATNLFTLATCDLSMFNLATFRLANVWYDLSFLASLVPTVSFETEPLPAVAGLSIGMGFPGIIPLVDPNMLLYAYGATLAVLLLMQVQLILISGSLLFLSLFMTLGLISRTFGFTRSFGGAMIAFGLGLGLIYPLLVSVTYGYINVNAHLDCFLSSATCGSNFSLEALLRAAISLLTTTGSSMLAPFYTQIGLILAGITFIPFLNFIILDAFIIDFSQAIGERMDFMALLAGIV